jgi:hypothetical protein
MSSIKSPVIVDGLHDLNNNRANEIVQKRLHDVT